MCKKWVSAKYCHSIEQGSFGTCSALGPAVRGHKLRTPSTKSGCRATWPCAAFGQCAANGNALQCLCKLLSADKRLLLPFPHRSVPRLRINCFFVFPTSRSIFFYITNTLSFSFKQFCQNLRTREKDEKGMLPCSKNSL